MGFRGDSLVVICMPKTENLLGIDIGSSHVRAVIAQEVPGEEALRVLGAVSLPSEGMRRGSVVDPDAVAATVTRAIEHAERMAGVSTRSVGFSVSGTDIFCQKAQGVIAVGRSDGEVTDGDVERAIEEVESRVMLPANREVLHVIPTNYRLDDQTNIKDPVGMRGVRLEAEAFVIGTSMRQMKGLSRIADAVGLTPTLYAVEPILSAEAALSPKQKELGVVLVDIGGSVTSVIVFEEGELLHMATLPVGAGHVTNDIAIGLRTSIDTAEEVKMRYGTALPSEVGKRDEIDLSELDSHEAESVSRHHVAEIVEARTEEIFRLVDEELKKISRDGMLPAGAVLVGGGSLLPGITDVAKRILRLPSHLGAPKPQGGIVDRVDGPDFASTVGLLLLLRDRAGRGFPGISGAMKMPDWAEGAGKKAKEWFRKFLPID
jgi:cell division protein FtsA